MVETTPPNPADAGLEVRTYFVRNRNVMLARADFGDLFVDYYLHLSTNGMKPAPSSSNAAIRPSCQILP